MLAKQDGKREALIIGTDTLLDKRMQQAFAVEWEKLGGVILKSLLFTGEQGGLLTLKQAVEISGADMVFLALDAKKARQVRPYIDSSVSIYATSQIFSGNNQGTLNFDLNGIRFVDMPWLLQSDHPAVMVYPRPKSAVFVDLGAALRAGHRRLPHHPGFICSRPPFRLCLGWRNRSDQPQSRSPVRA